MTNKEISPGSEVARGATYIFLQGLASAALGVIYIVFLTRILSPEEYGVFTVLTFILGLVQTFGLLALPSASIKYIAQFLAEDNREKAKGVAVRVLQISVFTSAAAFLGLFLLSGWISATLSIPILVVQTLALASIFVVLFFQSIPFLQGLQMMRHIAIVNLLYTVIQYGGALYLAYIGLGLLGVAIGWTIGLVVSSVIVLMLTAKYLGIFGKPYVLKPLLRFSYPIYIASVLGFFVIWIDQLFVLPYEGFATFGAYNIANRAAVVPGLVSSALVAALFPKLSQLYTQFGKDSLETAFTATTRYVVLAGFPMITLVAVLAYPIIVLFAGAQYAPAAFPLVLLSVASLFSALGVAISPTFFAMERSGIASIVAFASVLADAFFSYVFIALLGAGMIGAALAKIFAAVVGFFLGTVILKQFIRVKFATEMLWKVSVACVFMVTVVLGFDVVRQQLFGPPYDFLVFRLHLLPIYVIVGAVAYFFALATLRAVGKEDIELLSEYLPSKLKWIAIFLERFLKRTTK